MMNKYEILKTICSRYVVIIGGRYSSGKSLSLMALIFFDSLFNGINKFMSNMPLKLDERFIKNPVYTHLNQTKQFDDIQLNTLICWDEMHRDLNAKSPLSVKSKYVNIFSVDVAKKNSKIRGTLQFFDTLEKGMSLILELVIEPEYVNKYSKDTKEDSKIRFAKKDYKIKWKIWDRRDNSKYELILDLHPFIYMYNTKFAPYELIVNHKEFIEKLKINELNTFEIKERDDIKRSIRNFEIGQSNIGKVMIR